MLHLKNIFLIAIVSELIQGISFQHMLYEMKNTENTSPEIEGSLTSLFKLLDMFTVSFTGLNSGTSSGNDRSFCSIIRFLSIIQNSTKPQEREDSACILFKHIFPLLWTKLLKTNTPWKEGTEPSSFYAYPACTDAKTPPFTDSNPNMTELSEIRVHAVSTLLLNSIKKLICSNLFW